MKRLLWPKAIILAIIILALLFSNYYSAIIILASYNLISPMSNSEISAY